MAAASKSRLRPRVDGKFFQQFVNSPMITTLTVDPGGLYFGQHQGCLGGCFDPNKFLYAGEILFLYL